MRVPIQSASAEIEIKRSRFIAVAEYISEAHLIKERTLAMRKHHPGANHVVHAAVMGKKGSEFSLSDDHEPKNTAGRPALEVLKGSGITNILVMIIRYFGGTKLGTGGLVKAYADATKAVLEVLKTEELVEKTAMKLVIGYDIYEQVKQLLIEVNAEITEEFTDEVTIRCNIPLSVAPEITSQITDLSSGNARITDLPAQ
ncbi:MAG: IMPACT family protein [Sphaerochaetaceae bacterium]